MTNPTIKHRKTYQVRFTKFELLHLRDLMSITLPPEGTQTVSGALAAVENRQLIENTLWKKVSDACKEVGLPTGEDAPDYVVAPSGMTPLGVFQLSSDPFASTPEENDDEDDAPEGGSENIFDLFKKKGRV
jgi:hypothetical protein